MALGRRENSFWRESCDNFSRKIATFLHATITYLLPQPTLASLQFEGSMFFELRRQLAVELSAETALSRRLGLSSRIWWIQGVQAATERPLLWLLVPTRGAKMLDPPICQLSTRRLL